MAGGSSRTGSWGPATVLKGDAGDAVAELKARPGRELQVHGSGRLADALLEAGLVDTLRLVVAPTVLRAGRRLLNGSGDPAGLRLVRHEAGASGALPSGKHPLSRVNAVEILRFGSANDRCPGLAGRRGGGKA